MRTYTLEVVIEEGCDEFWEGYDFDGEGNYRGYATMEEVKNLVVEQLDIPGIELVGVYPKKLIVEY